MPHNFKLPFNMESVVHKVSVTSAVNAPLWACGVIALPAFFLATYNEGWLKIAFFVVGGVLILTFVGSYLLFAIRNPDYLRSEEYQLKKESLKLLGDRDNPLHAEANDLVAVVNNPVLPPPAND